MDITNSTSAGNVGNIASISKVDGVETTSNGQPAPGRTSLESISSRRVLASLTRSPDFTNNPLAVRNSVDGQSLVSGRPQPGVLRTASIDTTRSERPPPAHRADSISGQSIGRQSRISVDTKASTRPEVVPKTSINSITVVGNGVPPKAPSPLPGRNSVESYRSIKPPPDYFEGFPAEDYRKAGSMFSWSVPPYRNFFLQEAMPGPDHQIRGFQCWRYEDKSVEDKIIITPLEEVKIAEWCEEAIPLVNGKAPVMGCKILQTNQPYSDEIPIKMPTYKAILKCFDLPPVEMHAPSMRQGGCGVFPQEDDSYVVVHRRTNIRDLTSTVVRYDPMTNYTCGYIVTDFEPDRNRPRNMDYLYNFPYQYLNCPHPLIIPILFMEADFEHAMGLVKGFFGELKDIESDTGFTDRVDTRSDLGNLVNKDLQGLVRELGELHTLYLNNQSSLVAFQISVRILQRKLIYMDENMTPKGKMDLGRSSINIGTRMEFFSSCLEHSIIYGNIPTRLQAQQQVLFNLIAQADTQINIGLAKDSKELAAASKQDSSAMKIIAVLTTLFLPGTFIATFIAMPLFNWNEKSLQHVPTKHYWLYWAITGPVTIFTMSIVISWAIWRARKTRNLIRQAGDAAEKKKPQRVTAPPVSVHTGSELSLKEKSSRFTVPNFLRKRLNRTKFRRGRSRSSSGSRSRSRSPIGPYYPPPPPPPLPANLKPPVAPPFEVV